MSTDRQRVRALRGAITVEVDEASAIEAATVELLRAMLDKNGASPESLISVVFTATTDLVSEFPAVAARTIGISDVPLLCAQEIPVPGGIPRCIRVLMHLYTERDYASLRHVYLREARGLRTDLPE